jgi:hypothetical protein
MKQTRNIVVKALFNADEFLAFDEACKSANVTHSKALRGMANNFSSRRHDRRRQPRSEWPTTTRNMAMFLPGRVNYGVKMHMRS